MNVRPPRLTLQDLLCDPLTRAVMRSDGVSPAETVRICLDARRALVATAEARQSGAWQGVLQRPLPS